MIRAILLLLCFVAMFVEIPTAFPAEVVVNLTGAVGLLVLFPTAKEMRRE
jgi:hypothetical protein